MCASHGGEPRHVQLARADARGAAASGVDDLECGAHPPMHEPSARDARPPRRGADGAPQQLLGQARRPAARLPRSSGLPHAGYTDPAHPLQRRIRTLARPLRRHRRRRRSRSPWTAATFRCSACRSRRSRRPYARLMAGAPAGRGRAAAAAARARIVRAMIEAARTWWPARAASRRTFSRPAAAAGSARRAPRASTPSACVRRARGAHGDRRRVQDRGRLGAPARRGRRSRLLERLGALPLEIRRALAAYAEPVVHNARGRRRRPHRGGRADRASRARRGAGKVAPWRYRNLSAFLARARGARATSCASASASRRASRSPRSPTARSRAAARRCSSRTSRARRCRSRSTCSRSRRRMLQALEIGSWEEWDERLEFFLDPKPPEGILDKLKAIPKVTELAARVSEDGARAAPCQEVVDDGRRRGPRDAAGPDVLAAGRRPVHHDAARHHEGPGHGQDERRHVPHAGLRPRDDGHALAEAQGRRGPGARLRAGGPPDGGRRRDRLRSGDGLLRDRARCRRASRSSSSRASCAARPCRWSPAKTVDLLVPAEAEIVLEGYVDPRERRREGPFGDHTGFYSLDDDFPVFHVTAVTRREKPVYLTTIVGRPPMEDGFMGEAVERLFLPLVKKTIPEIVDMHLPVEGIFHNLMIVAIDKRYPGPRAQDDARDLGHGPDDVHEDDRRRRRGRRRPRHGPEVLWRALTAIDPERDIELVQGPVDELDFAARLAVLRQQDRDRRDPQVEGGGLRRAAGRTRSSCRRRSRRRSTRSGPPSGSSPGPSGLTAAGRRVLESSVRP